MNKGYTQNEITSWLKKCLKQEDITEMTVEIVGYSEKGDGYLSDIVFVNVLGKEKDGSPTEYNLALKCSRGSALVEEIKSIFINEIYFYDDIIPAFTKFQLERGIREPFNSIAKCYGTMISDERELIILENLMKTGYSLWDKKKPLTRKHITLVVKEYAKFHAISVAMKDQEAEKYEKLTEPYKNLFKKDGKMGNKMVENFANGVQYAHDILKGDLDDDILTKWQNFGKEMKSKFVEIAEKFDGLTVVVHGDCWNNNFLFRTEGNDLNLPLNVKILDWQISRLSTPVHDLSHFLFSCLSDFDDLDSVLEEYYQAFSTFLGKVGSSPEKLYPRGQFFRDWKTMSKMGLFLISTMMKVCTVEKEDVPDLIGAATEEDFTKALTFNVKNIVAYKNRVRPMVKYAVDKGLVEF